MKTLVDYAMCFIGIPYHWGGKNPVSGFDCSGLVEELLKSVGMELPEMNAQNIYNHFQQLKAHSNVFCPGALAFFGKSLNEITHIAFLIDGTRMIEAGGGTSTTLTTQDAAAKGAFVRIRSIHHRKDLVGTLLPEYPADVI